VRRALPVLVLALLALVAGDAPRPVGGVLGVSHVFASCTVTGSGSVRSLLARLGPGDVGCLSGGTYRENVDVRRGGRPGAPITLRAAPGARATIVGRFVVHPEAHDVVVAGLRLDGRNADRAPSPTVAADRVTFSDNDVTNGHTGICFTLGYEDPAVGIVLQHNRIHDCGRLPATNKEHGIYVERTRGARIVDNLIYDNADRGIQLYPDAQDTLIERNVIDGNGQGVAFGGEGDDASSGTIVRNNVISNSRLRYNVESYFPDRVGDDNLAASNCLWRGSDGNIGEQVGFRAAANVVADPLYVNRAAKNFRLPRTSPCAGKGPR
jgi:parallel beta-helix repeat protein